MPGSRIFEGYLPPLQAVKVGGRGANVRLPEIWVPEVAPLAFERDRRGTLPGVPQGEKRTT
jgi:hypothetical protein